MKKYAMVTPETLNKLGKCFSGPEEVETFILHMDGLVEELAFQIELRKRLNEEYGGVFLLKQVAIITLFFREHMDLIHQLVNNLQCEEITEEELKKLIGE